MNLMADDLLKISANEGGDLESAVKRKVCDIKSKRCIYGECETCKDRKRKVKKDILDVEVTWFAWKIKNEGSV